jgi:hypothetical protein
MNCQLSLPCLSSSNSRVCLITAIFKPRYFKLAITASSKVVFPDFDFPMKERIGFIALIQHPSNHDAIASYGFDVLQLLSP